MTTETLMGLLIAALTIASYGPYARDMVKGKVRPHPLTWSVWSILLTLLSLTMLKNGAGAGAIMPIGSCAFTLFITQHAWRYDRKLISKNDIPLFAAAMAAIPVWMLLESPVYALVMMMCIDLAAFWPTLRKSWHMPHTETASAWFINTMKHVATLFALQLYVFETAFYPSFLLILNLSFTLLLVLRQNQLRLAPNPL